MPEDAVSDHQKRSDRDEHGRFQHGNPGGPGNPYVRRQAEYQAALREVMTPSRLKIVLATLLKAVVDRQDVQAARVLLDRVLGRPRSEPLPENTLDLPNGVETASDVARAVNALLQGMATGVLAPDDAHRAAAIVELARRAIETQDLARRIEALESNKHGRQACE